MRCSGAYVAIVFWVWCGAQAFHEAPEVGDAAHGADCYSPYDGKPLVKLSPSSQVEREAMKVAVATWGCTDWGDESKHVLFVVCDVADAFKVVALYSARGSILTSDAGAHFRQSSGTVTLFETSAEAAVASDFYEAWRSYDDRMARLASMVNRTQTSPIANVTVAMEDIGTSFEGRSMKAVRITGAGGRTKRRKVVMTFQQHAREWIAGMAGVFAVEHMLAKARNEPAWLTDVELVLVPISNPDGFIFTQDVERMFRKNRRRVEGASCIGVDLNRNWEPAWNGGASTSTNPCSDVFVGSAAFSEPEVQALKGLLDEDNVSVHIDVHSYSELILRPWMYTPEAHPRIQEIDELGLMMQAAMAAAPGGTRYTYGGPEILYAASGIAPDYSTLKGALGFTFELRPSPYDDGGFAPPPGEILPACHESFAAMLVAIDWVKDDRPLPGDPLGGLPLHYALLVLMLPPLVIYCRSRSEPKPSATELAPPTVEVVAS